MSTVYSPEFFQHELVDSYRSAKRVVPPLLGLLGSVRSIADFGCGTGHFLKAFLEAGVSDAIGIDGQYVPRNQLVVDPRLFIAADLSRPFNLGRRFDLAVSLEVAEHLPPDSAESFVDTLVAHSPVVLFSAAIPHQGGTNHVNEQWQSYWARLFEKRGFHAYDELRERLWMDVEVAWWYRQNSILYCSKDFAAGHESLSALRPCSAPTLDRVHPQLLVAWVNRYGQLAREQKELFDYLTTGEFFAVERTAEGQFNLVRKSERV